MNGFLRFWQKPKNPRCPPLPPSSKGNTFGLHFSLSVGTLCPFSPPPPPPPFQAQRLKKALTKKHKRSEFDQILTMRGHAKHFLKHLGKKLFFHKVNVQSHAKQNTHDQSNDKNGNQKPQNPLVCPRLLFSLAISHRSFRAGWFCERRCSRRKRSRAVCPRRTLDGVDVIATHLIGRQTGLFNALLLFIVVFAVGAAPRTRMTISSNCSIVAVTNAKYVVIFIRLKPFEFRDKIYPITNKCPVFCWTWKTQWVNLNFLFFGEMCLVLRAGIN